MGSGQSNPDGSPKTIYDHINYHIQNVGNIAGKLTTAVGSAKSALSSFSSTAGLGTDGRGEYGGGFFDGGAAENDKKPLASIIAYRQSKSHESKQLLAEKLIQALKIAGVTVRENGDIADIAKAIMEKLPNPHKGQSYKVESESQKNVLKALVKGLNDSFSPGASADLKFIPTTYGLEEIARQAMELVYSMTTGVHDEFLTVQASVVNALHNVKVLRKLMDSAHEEVVSQANNLIANSERDTSNYTSYQEIYKRIAKECDRQITMLSNMLDSTMGPEINVIQQLADESSADYKYIKKYVLDNNMDLKTAALIMAHLVHGISATAVMLTTTDKIFSDIGEQMLNLKGATEEAVDAAIDELIRKDPSNAPKYINWKGPVKMYNEEQKVLAETMAKHSSLDNDNINGRKAIRGAADPFGPRINKYAANYKKSNSEKRIIFSDYISKSSALYAKLLAAVDAIGPRIGGEIPISDKLLDLREAFVSLADEENGLGRGSLEKALIGFDLEIESRQRRDAFMNKMRLVKTVLEQVVGMSVYSGVRQYFDPMVSAVNSIVEQADMYYDIVKQKYGSKEGGADGDDDDYQLPEVARSAHDLNKSVNSFVYYMYVAKVRENLKQTHSEVESYGEKYTQLLGEAVACRLRDIDTAYDAETKVINEAFDVKNLLKAVAEASAPLNNIDHACYMNHKIAKETCKKYSKKQYECKKNFYKSLQAVDLYLKEFTEGVTAHPEDIADIKQMLTGVDLIGPWYDDKTGNNLAHGFDAFNNDVNVINDRPLRIWVEATGPANLIGAGGGPVLSDENVKLGYITGIYDFHALKDEDNIGDVHYYTRLGRSTLHMGNPTGEFNLLRADHRKMAEIAVKRFAETYDNFQALKNIINAIVRMGDKFGNKELRNSVFLSPSEIFKNLMAYLKCSATSFKIDKGDIDTIVTNAKKHVINTEGGTGGLIVVGLPGAGGAPLVAANQPAPVNDHDMGFWFSPAGATHTGGGVVSPKNGIRDSTLAATLKVGAVGAATEFQTEDNYFQMIVKAMATKILTVIGVYDLFNRPGPVYDLTPTRMIIGGAMDQVEVLPEAAELYFRLTRLAEYYRQDAFTQYDAATAADNKFIGFIPDVGGVFAGLTRLIWLKFGLSTVDQGSYSDSELRQLITEINSIYHHFKGESDHSVTSKACNEFVMEINRRYGVVKKSDYENYYKMIRAASSLGDRNEFNNYAILPGEGELRGKRAAPSDTYISLLSKTDINITPKCETTLDTGDVPFAADTYKKMLDDFRTKLNNSFTDARGGANPVASDYNKFVNISYSTRIKQAESKMHKESEVERFHTVAQLIRGSDGLASTDVARDFFFHETVVTGLNTLTAVTKMLQHIRVVVGMMIGAAGNPGSIVTIATTVGNADYKDSVQLTGRYDKAAFAAPPAAGNAGAGAEALLRDIIILVNGLNNSFGDKVKVRFPQGRTSQLLVDFTDLSNSLDDLMDSVRYFINLMRQTMSRNTIEKYEGTLSNPVEGTYRWLERHLSNDLLKGQNNRYSDPVAANANVGDTTTLEYVAKEINNMYTYIVHNFHTLRPAISELVYYNAALSTSLPPAAAVAPVVPVTIPSNAGGGGAIAAAAAAVADYIGNSNINFLIADKPATRKSGQTTTVNRTYFNHIIRTWSGDNLNTTRSMMMLFNQLLAMYIRTFYDESSGKTYRGLIESFASGSFNQAVTSVGVEHVFTDLYYNVNPAATGGTASTAVLSAYREAQTLNAPRTLTTHAANGINALVNNLEPQVVTAAAGAPPANVLLQSLALILQRLMTDNTREGVSEHLISTLSEVPMFIREKMRAYLPVFSKMFNMVQQQGEFIKQLLEQTDLVLGANQNKSASAEVGVRNAMTACINKIVDGCYTLANSSSDVTRELADEPKFLQTQENSIRDYQSRYGKLPLMPLSSVLNYLQILNNENEDILLPTYSLGTAQFKMMYGTRGLLNDHVWKSSSAPGVSQVLEQYRSSSNAGVDESKYEKLVAGVVGVVQSLVDLRYFSTSTTLHMLSENDDAINALATASGNAGAGNAPPAADIAIATAAGVRDDVVAAITLATTASANVGVAIATAVALVPVKGPGALKNTVFKPNNMYARATYAQYAVAPIDPLVATLNNMRVYQLRDNINQTMTLSLTESSNQAAQLQHITSAVGSAFGAVTNQDARKIERMYNIVDMNIIPVNVHALMRGMPLAPLYNYTYTFEENARLALGVPVNWNAEPTNAREWFFKILENPYYDVVTAAGPAMRSEFNNNVIDQINTIPHPTVYANVPEHALVVAVARAVDEFVARTWVAPYNLDAAAHGAAAATVAANAIKLLVHNVAAPGDDAALAVIIRNTYRLAIQAGAYSTPAAQAQLNTAAGRVIATVLAANAELDALFHSRAYETNGAGVNAAAASAGNTRTRVIAIATQVAVGLILARNLNMDKLHPVQIDAINTTLARLLVHAPPNDREVDSSTNVTNADRLLVAALNQDTEVSARAAVTALVTAGAGGANSPLGIEVAAAGGGDANGRNDHNARVIDVLAEIGILTALVNNMDTSVRLNRYSLDRHSTNDRTLASLMHGDETLLMGRPKFISDQLFHKVLPTLDSSGHMNYYDNGTSHPVPAAAGAFTVPEINRFRDVFQARFNTLIVRNLMHCTNVQRVLRLRLNQELTSYRDVLVNSESITNPSVTEFGNLRWSDMRLNGTVNRTMDPRNEDAQSRTYNSEETVGIPR